MEKGEPLEFTKSDMHFRVTLVSVMVMLLTASLAGIISGVHEESPIFVESTKEPIPESSPHIVLCGELCDTRGGIYFFETTEGDGFRCECLAGSPESRWAD